MNPIIKYFYGEKSESYLFILIGLIAMSMALYFLFGLKTSFWKGVAIPFIIVSILELVVGYTIVRRTPEDIERVEFFLDTEPEKINNFEIPRMNRVMSNFVIFRYAEIAIIILGIGMMYHTMTDTIWRGIGLGLFIQAGIVLVLDFFAERRGQIYLEYLKSLTE